MANPYESPKLASEYLLFHYGREDEILFWDFGPREALNFAVRTVTELADGPPKGRALDLGCAVGRSSFELSRTCHEVLGIDYSAAFIEIAERLRSGESISFLRQEEAHLATPLSATRPQECAPERIHFERGDAMDLRADLGAFDLVHAANLLCRLSDPSKLLDRLPTLVRPGGALLLATPCTWLEEFTPPAHWPPGGTFAWLESVLEPHFRLELQRDMPFLIRETARKFQWTVALGTRWRRR